MPNIANLDESLEMMNRTNPNGNDINLNRTDLTVKTLTSLGVDAKSDNTTYPDGKGPVLGTGSDVAQQWNGTYLQMGSGMWANAPSPADPNYHAICNEFVSDFGVLSNLSSDWTVTEDDAADTQAITATATLGELLLTQKATTDDDAAQIVLATQPFAIAANKKLWMEFKIKTAAGATQIDWSAGLILAADLTGVADNMPANGIVISKLDGATAYKLSSSDNGTDTEGSSLGVWDTSYHTLGFYFNGGASGVGTITPYVDGVAGTPIVCTYATMAKVSPFFMVRNGDATTTQTLTIDYVKVVQLR